MEAPPFASSASSSSLFSLRNKPLSSTRLTHFGNTKQSRNFSVRASSSGDSVVTLLDYGAGNVRSVRNAIRSLGFDIKDVQTLEDILNASRLVFPGVGAFAAAMEVLTKTGQMWLMQLQSQLGCGHGDSKALTLWPKSRL